MARRFTLLDEPYFDALVRVVEAFQTAGLPIQLVGGGAVQVWVAALRTGFGQARLSDAAILKGALRSTRDLDFATRSDAAETLVVLNRLALVLGPGTHVLGARSLRLGQVTVSLSLGPEDLSGMAAHYDDFLQRRQTVGLRRSIRADLIPVIGLADLVATKLTRRGDKAKDLVDLEQLASAMRSADVRLDRDAVERLLGDDSEAKGLLDELDREIAGD
ncbi:MAG: hypothetical protein HYV07_31830 [Deltaproteobacteria bacterium]|nr:hypothetical protein [Deltaproteobacteria bacterium]